MKACGAFMYRLQSSYIHDLLIYTRILLNNGENKLASHSACMAFEGILPKVKLRKGQSFYEEAITEYCRRYKQDHGVKFLLDRCKRLRNEIIHDHVYFGAEELYKHLCSVTNFNADTKIADMDHEDLARFRKKSFFCSRPVSGASVDGEESFDGFNDEDFRNLHEMRHKFGELKAVLQQVLNDLKPRISFDDVTTPNGAYVWLAAVDDSPAERPKIDRPSLSVLATNHDFRIYLDFGGRCKKERLVYCDMLLNKKLDTILVGLDSQYKIFDVYWYYNIENLCTVSEFLENRDDNILMHDQKYYDMENDSYGVTTIEDRINKYVQYVQSNKTVAENKLLIGKIFDKAEVVKEGANIVKTITSVFRDIHPLYKTIIKRARHV